jgi:hypothetical protein
MGAQKQIELSDKWVKAFGLDDRSAPEIYYPQDSIAGSAHAGAIRDSFEKIGLSALFCVQGVPTLAYLVQEQYDQAAVIDIHAKLWNQGLASALLVITNETLRFFSLARLPLKESDHDFENSCLIDALKLSEESLRIKSIITGAETGRLWAEHKDFFKLNERVDYFLLNNLILSHNELIKDLNTESAQALLMQTMFISYLEDRSIISSSYYESLFDGKVSSLYEILSSGKKTYLERLFASLARDFNGSVFVSPSSFETRKNQEKITSHHLEILTRFRAGNEDMQSGQRRFWGYNFQYIPVELISAVYDRFLGEKESERKELGAYYTPMFLADTVMAQLWDTISDSSKRSGSFLDPACGSGVFLVRSFQLLCEQWKLSNNVRTIQWSNLCSILERVHGWDINGNAVRVAIFSLYIALLEQVSPPDIKKLIKKGKMLPNLWGKTLIERDFFTVESSPEANQYDVIVGNPPWASRRNPARKSISWCKDNKYPMPGNEDAWAFTWKSLEHLREKGIISFLVPAMGLLHNPKSFTARALLTKKSKLLRIINFSDLRFQLFGGAISPTALIILGKNTSPSKAYNIEYWVPKADLNLQLNRNITISSRDRVSVTSSEVENDYFALKSRLWMRPVDQKLYRYLASFTRLGDFIHPYKSTQSSHNKNRSQWLIGQGFQPFNDGRSSSIPHNSDEVSSYPYLPVQSLDLLYQKSLPQKHWPTSEVRRKGFEAAYGQSKILVSRGVGTSQMRLKAAYCDKAATFQDILMAIIFPEKSVKKAKVLNAYLNSKLALWFAFHGTASFGSGRPEVKQAELLKLPFPTEGNNEEVENDIVEIIDDLKKGSTNILSSEDEIENSLRKIDALIYRYFDLSEEEISIIEDTVNYIIPASQPHQNTIPYIWGATNAKDREEYSKALVSELNNWVDEGNTISAKLAGKNRDFGLLELQISDIDKPRKSSKYQELDMDLGSVIDDLAKAANVQLPGNFTLIPDFRLFVANKLYLVKPLSKLHWMKSSALEDADSIAMDIQSHLVAEKD